jgi:SAM-dependent methyltransferase
VSLQTPYHADRARAESFGAVADAYDRYRPGYPDELIVALVALQPSAVLDVGCGTGKAARQLAGRGLPVLGVEIDPKMAAFARDRGVEVEVASFEHWDDRGRTFDLIVSGQAWHWVDPAVGAPKLVRLLRPGGTVCLFWNFEDLDEPTGAAVERVYRRLAPELAERDHRGAEDETHAESLRSTECFGFVRSERYRWRQTLSIDEWIGRMSTYSKQLLLGSRLAEIQDALRAELGETVQLSSGTYVVWARP